jgi:CDP-6-deoxy-D-xylo-4-hexulose-3-dehydrase
MCKNIDKKVCPHGYPNADNIMERGVLLPLHHGLTEDMFARLHQNIDEFIRQNT